MLFHGCIIVVTWFSEDQPSYNTMADADTNKVNHVSTLFATQLGSYHENSTYTIGVGITNAELLKVLKLFQTPA